MFLSDFPCSLKLIEPRDFIGPGKRDELPSALLLCGINLRADRIHAARQSILHALTDADGMAFGPRPPERFRLLSSRGVGCTRTGMCSIRFRRNSRGAFSKTSVRSLPRPTRARRVHASKPLRNHFNAITPKPRTVCAMTLTGWSRSFASSKRVGRVYARRIRLSRSSLQFASVPTPRDDYAPGPQRRTCSSSLFNAFQRAGAALSAIGLLRLKARRLREMIATPMLSR